MGIKMRYRVRESRRTPYAEPIVLARGEVVTVGEEYREEPRWPGWIWCETDDAKCWAPVQIIEKKGKSRGILRQEYIATELNVDHGDIVEADRELNGWVWGKNTTNGQLGWVPVSILEPEEAR